MADKHERRRGRGLRWLLIAAAAVVLLPLAGLAVFALTFDPDSVKPRIEQAVKRATGRDLALKGRLGLKLSLWPTLEARDVALANIPGGSRPEMATLRRLEAQVALLPLLRRTIDVERLVLVEPDILLETDAGGRPNWRFSPEEPSRALPQAAPRATGAPLSVAVRQVDVEGGRLTWRDGRTGRSVPVDLADAAVRADGADAPIDLALHGFYAGAPFTVSGQTGSLARLREREATTPWPVRLALGAATATLAVDGALSQPEAGRGRFKLDGAVPDLAALAVFSPSAPLPPLHDVRLSAEVAADDGGAPSVSGSLRAGASDLGRYVPGLRLQSLAADLARAGEPVRFNASGALRDAAWSMTGSATRDGATSATVRDLALTTPAGVVSGEVGAGWGSRPSLRAILTSPSLDLDALLAAVKPAALSAPAGSAPAPAAAGNPAPAAARDKRVFSDRPIPFALLRAADADLRLGVTTVRSGGQEYHDLAGHLVLSGGRLTVDPIGGRFPAGRLDGRMAVDATGPDAAVALTLRGPGVQIAPLLPLLNLPGGVRGAADIDADLRGVGNSAHALAATVDGHLGIAAVNGEIDNRLLSATLGQVLQHARLPDITARPGSLPVRCFAVRLDAHAGVADIRALLLDTPLFYLEGSGSLQLGDETLAVRLRPLARLGGTGVIVPLRVGGGFRAPKVEVDAAGAAGEVAGMAAGAAARSPQLGLIIGALNGNGMVAGSGSDDCGRQLALARGGLPGPAPEPQAPETGKAPKPVDLLRRFLR